MLQGTGSDVGKTVLVAGLCRALMRRGHSVLPFKPQNMSNNAAVTIEGGEIGRGQWLQALACGVDPSIHMNPVLLKPQSNARSQIVVHGKMSGEAGARDYQTVKKSLMTAVLESFAYQTKEADFVIVEGAGSPAEINLRANDIANMGFASVVEAPVVLVGDIDRGGVIASVVGTHAILDSADRTLIAGYIINKFRGDVSLFDDGLVEISKRTDWPCFGVLPWQSAAARLPAEDSVVLDKTAPGKGGRFRIAVPTLPRIANFDDFAPLEAEPDVDLIYVRPGDTIPVDAQLVILPGSKATIADLEALRRQGWDIDLAAHVRRGGYVLGICGGYQMLGRVIDDPDGIEGNAGRVEGLSLLDVETVLEPEKTVRETSAVSSFGQVPVSGYEIHIGRTTGPDCANPMLLLDNRPDGAVSENGRVQGCYVHGLFTGDQFRRWYLESIGFRTNADVNYNSDVQAALDELATGIEKDLDVDALVQTARPPKF